MRDAEARRHPHHPAQEEPGEQPREAQPQARQAPEGALGQRQPGEPEGLDQDEEAQRGGHGGGYCRNARHLRPPEGPPADHRGLRARAARARAAGAEYTRRTTVFHLQGGGHEGVGEDVNYAEEEQLAQQQAGPVHPLAGEWTLDSFSRHLDGLDLFPDGEPGMPAFHDYRRWAYESAALDLALRQAGTSLHAALDREPRPLTFGVSLRLAGSAQGVRDRIEAYGDSVRFKLDYEATWDAELIDALAQHRRGRRHRPQGRLQGHDRRRRHGPGGLRRLRRGVRGRLARGPRPHRRGRRPRARAPPRPHHLGRAHPRRRGHRPLRHRADSA